MNWQPFMNNVYKVSSRIRILKCVMPCLTLLTAQTVNKSIIQPLFDNCGVVLDTCHETSSLRLQRLQNRARRVILSVDDYNPLPQYELSSIGGHHETTEEKKIQKRHSTYKNQIEGLDMNCLRRSEIHRYNARNNKKFLLP